MSNERNQKAWIAVAALWPLVVLTVATIWPGPDDQSQLHNYFLQPAYDQVAPPVDTQGVKGELSVSGESGAKVFWEIPRGDEVKLRIEVPADKRVRRRGGPDMRQRPTKTAKGRN